MEVESGGEDQQSTSRQERHILPLDAAVTPEAGKQPPKPTSAQREQIQVTQGGQTALPLPSGPPELPFDLYCHI